MVHARGTGSGGERDIYRTAMGFLNVIPSQRSKMLAGPFLITPLTGQGPLRKVPLTPDEWERGREYHFTLVPPGLDGPCSMCAWSNNINIVRIYGNDLQLVMDLHDELNGINRELKTHRECAVLVLAKLPLRYHDVFRAVYKDYLPSFRNKIDWQQVSANLRAQNG